MPMMAWEAGWGCMTQVQDGASVELPLTAMALEGDTGPKQDENFPLAEPCPCSAPLLKLIPSMHNSHCCFFSPSPFTLKQDLPSPSTLCPRAPLLLR